MTKSLTIRHLVFTGPQVEPAELEFKAGPNLIYGASNTGKSFTLKSIDFMLGGSKPLPDIDERTAYETIWFGFTLEGIGDLTLSRSLRGGGYLLHEGLLKSGDSQATPRKLGQTHSSKSTDNLSRFLLDYLDLDDKLVARDAAGQKDVLSFRDLVNILLVDETSIQAERSPIESGQHPERPKEHSVFRLLITGADDSAIVTVVDKKTFDASKAARLAVMEDMIADTDLKLENEYPDVEDLPTQNQRLETLFEKVQSEFDVAQGSIRELLDEKRRLAVEIPNVAGRREEIRLHYERFDQLDRIYRSDIERLGALEEAGFLLTLGGDKACPLCGAPAEAQKHTHGLENVEDVREASFKEIAKIESQRIDLRSTVLDLKREDELLQSQLTTLYERLELVEAELASLTPKVNEIRRNLSELISTRDHVRRGLALLEQRGDFVSRRDGFSQDKRPSKADKPDLNVPGNTAHDFCQVVSRVLTAWDFPGERQVSFDEKTYDLRIDGKLRSDNGKGIRAVTHAAFKVALLIYCRERGLPHPGFVVLDTPLLTYRDPMKNPKLGELTDDERALAKTPLKERFFEHLYSIRNFGQFIVLENIDPPQNVEQLAHVEIFYGESGGERYGLFPLSV